ncbi:MAG: hypothetical protein HY075_12180 [Deltaproteobacteria bacterium]|nr:hypothetical protein [Deltaproteobacteria bacterium]
MRAKRELSQIIFLFFVFLTLVIASRFLPEGNAAQSFAPASSSVSQELQELLGYEPG